MKYLIGFLILFFTSTIAFTQNAVIREITGTVELKRSANAAWVPANIGDRLDRNTIISTGFRSTAVIQTGNSVINVRPVTRLSLEAIINMNEETVSVNLNTGRINVDIKPPAGSRADFTVQNPSSVASVRGTTFELDEINISVTEGVVRFESASDYPANPVLVTANQSSWIDMDTGKPISAIDASAINRRLPGLAGEDSMLGMRTGGLISGGLLDPNGNVNVGVNLANNRGDINIGTSLANSHGGINIGTNLGSGQGSVDIGINVSK